MAKKRNLRNSLTDEESAYVAAMKLGGDSGVEYVGAFRDRLRMMSIMKLDIKCKTEKQKEFLNTLKDTKKEICIGMGAAGTGKSFISLSYALKQLKEGNYKQIVMIVPTAPAGGADMALGYLKGELEDKIRPYTESDKETIEKILDISGNINSKQLAGSFIASGFIRYEFINFLLGKTFDNSLLLLNEAEQFTKDNMKLVLTRMGEGSKLIITGDCEQVNRKAIVNGKEQCGLSYVADKIKVLGEVGIVEFSRGDIVRNKLITKILDCLG